MACFLSLLKIKQNQYKFDYGQPIITVNFLFFEHVSKKDP